MRALGWTLTSVSATEPVDLPSQKSELAPAASFARHIFEPGSDSMAPRSGRYYGSCNDCSVHRAGAASAPTLNLTCECSRKDRSKSSSWLDLSVFSRPLSPYLLTPRRAGEGGVLGETC